MHGQGVDKYDNTRIGMNGRMDTIQAAILIEKLKIFADEIQKRQAVATRYNDGLKDIAVVPRVMGDCVSTWAQYTIKIGKGRRDAVAAALKERGIPTAIYYPKPLHQQTAYKHYPSAGNGLPVSDVIAQDVLSLPMHPYLAADLQDRIIQATRDAIAA
jgi:dTDP-4-amino-4,6-dideoxygalactose transaminase